MFDALVIHPSSEKQLETIVSRPPHALLLAGKAHLGKRLIARSVAAELLGITTDKLDDSGAYREVLAVKNTIAVETVRELIAFFSLTVPGKAHIKRVALVPDAEMMTHAAQNALLKALEEPPVDTVIILTSSHPDTLLATIRSRCQTCRIQTPTSEDVWTFLGDYDETAVQTALITTKGAIGSVKSLLDQPEAPSVTLESAKTFLGLSVFEQLIAVDAYSKDREAAQEFISLLLVVAEKGALHSRSVQWQHIFQAVLTADEALQKNANVKLTLLELVLSLR